MFRPAGLLGKLFQNANFQRLADSKGLATSPRRREKVLDMHKCFLEQLGIPIEEHKLIVRANPVLRRKDVRDVIQDRLRCIIRSRHFHDPLNVFTCISSRFAVLHPSSSLPHSLLRALKGMSAERAAELLDKSIKLLSSLGCKEPRKLICKFPQLMAKGEERIRQHLEAIEAIVGVPGESRQLAFRQPQLLHANLITMEAVWKELVAQFGTKNALNMVYRQPSILTTKRETLLETYDEFVKLFGKERAEQLVFRVPVLLSLKWSGLGPKLLFLCGYMHFDREEVFDNPHVLARSLNSCLLPRWRALERAEHPGRFTSISKLFHSTKEEFESRFKVKIGKPKIVEEVSLHKESV